MVYNFDEKVDRSLTKDLKWSKEHIERYGYEYRDGMVPMWLADSDVKCCPSIIEAISKRVENGIYGYCAPTKEFYDAINFYYSNMYNLKIDKKWISDLPSVVAGINIAISALTDVGDGVIIQTPVYDPFSRIVERTNRIVYNNRLIEKNGEYSIDFDDLESKAKLENVKMIVLCSPHNPVGRVWSREELERLADICHKNNLIIVSDEIHSGLTYKNFTHTPILSLDSKYIENVIMLSSGAKAFNIAGLKIAYAIIPNEDFRTRFNETKIAANLDVRNNFGQEGLIGAYSETGLHWLGEVLDYYEENIEIIDRYLKDNFKGKIKMVRPGASFLAWLDYRETGLSDEEFMKKLLEANILCMNGKWFGPGGEGHVRFNFGTTKEILIHALDSIDRVFFKGE